MRLMSNSLSCSGSTTSDGLISCVFHKPPHASPQDIDFISPAACMPTRLKSQSANRDQNLLCQDKCQKYTQDQGGQYGRPRNIPEVSGLQNTFLLLFQLYGFAEIIECPCLNTVHAVLGCRMTKKSFSRSFPTDCARGV